MVPETARCEDVLPLFAEHDRAGVSNDAGEPIGSITARQVIKALARYSPSVPAPEPAPTPVPDNEPAH